MEFLEITYLIILSLLGYLLGSIPFALVVGKYFYNIDLRQYGSKNLGGTNAGRILGKKVGLIVIICDTLKCSLTLFISQFILRLNNFSTDNIAIILYIIGFSVVIGHCFPVFAKFKGGKAVSVTGGFFLATNYLLTIFALLTLIILVIITKYVSLSSMIGVLISFGFTFIPIVQKAMLWGIQYHLLYSIFIAILALIIIYRHKSNIKRLISGTEKKSYLLRFNKKS